MSFLNQNCVVLTITKESWESERSQSPLTQHSNFINIIWWTTCDLKVNNCWALICLLYSPQVSLPACLPALLNHSLSFRLFNCYVYTRGSLSIEWRRQSRYLIVILIHTWEKRRERQTEKHRACIDRLFYSINCMKGI